MAQHIETQAIEHKSIRKIENHIIKVVSKGISGIAGSLKWEEIKYQEFKINENDRVFTTERSVPESLVCGGRAIFELHYDTKKNIILRLYMVA